MGTAVVQISLKLLGKLVVIMDFYALQNYLGFLDFGLKLSEE